MSQVQHTKHSFSYKCVYHGNRLLILLHHCRQVSTINKSWENKPENIFMQIWFRIFRKKKNHKWAQFSFFSFLQGADLIKLTIEVHLSNFITPNYEAISSYYLTSSASHLTSISELLSGIFLALTDSDRFGTLTAVKWYWMAAFNHNTVLNCRQSSVTVWVCCVVWASFMMLATVVLSGAAPMSFHSTKPCKIRWGTSDPDQLKWMGCHFCLEPQGLSSTSVSHVCMCECRL